MQRWSKTVGVANAGEAEVFENGGECICWCGTTGRKS